MLPVTLMIAAQAAAGAAAPQPPACAARQLSLSVDGRDGDFNGMSHSGTEVSIRNHGADCTLNALPAITFTDKHGRILPVQRRSPVGMHPGPVLVPVTLSAGHRATTDLRWVSGPVFTRNRRVSAATLVVRLGRARLRVACPATLYGEVGKTVYFDQTALRAAEGMAEG